MDELKICFVWVEQFRNFKNTGFNFSSSHKFDYDVESNAIIRKDIDKLPKSFFGERIIDVTGLIGINGSGKSNVLELLCKVLKGGKSTISKNFIIITEEKGEFILYHNNFLLLNIPPIGNFEFETKVYEGSINPLKIVYFSNVYDQRQNNFSDDISDISNNYRYSNKYRFSNLKSSRFIKKEKTDFEKQLEFINSNLFEDIEIETPDTILITSKSLVSNRLNSSQIQRIFLDNTKKYKDFLIDLRKRLSRVNPKRRFYYSLVFSFFQEVLFNIRIKDRDKNSDLDNFINNVNQEENKSTEALVDYIICWLVFISTERLREYDFNYEAISIDNFRSKLEVLVKLKDLIDSVDIDYDYEGSRGLKTELFSFKFKRNSANVFLKAFIKLNLSRNFTINWSGISSGHKAYLNLFSLIYSELKRIKTQNVLICIDEGDLYLHPKWQIEFFGKLLVVLPKIYSGNIQIILTSHSPFLLSDIPKQCLTILNKKDKNYSINGIELEKETFAGNIYDLYEAPFFLGNQKKSVFSTQKIKEILLSLKEDKGSIPPKDISKLISLIGDDVIRFHLNKLNKND